MEVAPPGQDRLDSWKQIAAYLNKSERTVRRWQESEGLPVHKHAHRQRGSVWAYREELDRWLAERVVRPEPPPGAPAPNRLRSYLAATVLAGAAVLSLVFVYRGKEPRRMPDPLPLTNLPGAEYGASFSPDGQQVVFHWSPPGFARAGLYVKNIRDDRVTPLAVCPPGADFRNYSAAWSPDGTTIAFLRRMPDKETWLVLTGSKGGRERKLLRISTASMRYFANHQHVSWSPDSRWLYVPMSLSDAERGIYRVSAETGAATAVIKSVSDYAPAVSPDGRFLVSLRVRGLPHAFQEVWLHKLNSDGLAEGSPALLYKGYSVSSGIAWMPDSKNLLICNAETALFGPFDSRLYWLPAVAGARMTEAGGTACSNVTVSRQGQVAYGSRTRARSKMLQSALPATDPPREFVASSRYDSYPSFSPDGSSLAFYSTRSGKPEVWVAQRDGTGLRRITENSLLHSGPVWSPDGARILYVSGRSLAIIPARQGGTPVRIEAGSGMPQNPVWSAGGQTIYYTSGSHLCRMQVDGTGRAILGELQPIMSLVESPDGDSLYFTRFGRNFALFRMAADGGHEQLIEDGLALASIAITRRALYFVRAADMGLYALQLSGGKATRIAVAPAIEAGGIRQWETQFTISPDDSSIVWTLTEFEEADLEMLRL